MSPLLESLIRLTPLTVDGIASRIGLTKSNLAAAISGRRAIPDRCMPALLEVLGLDSAGRLRRERVYVWRLQTWHTLQTLVALTAGSGSLWPLRSARPAVLQRDQYWILGTPTGARADYVQLAIIKTRLSPDDDDRRGGGLQFLAPIAVDSPADWWPSSPRQAVLTLLAGSAPGVEPTWEDVIGVAESRGLSCAAVLAAINALEATAV